MRSGTPEQAPDCVVPPVRVHVVHNEHCQFTEQLLGKIKEDVPAARITSEITDDEGAFEYFVNDKLVYSKLHLSQYPNMAEMVEIAFWCNKGKSFMHLYLCTVAEGGEPNMIIADRKKTPIAKRVLMTCAIS